MQGQSSNNRFDLKKIEEILITIKNDGNLEGVLFSTRDGNLISKAMEQDFEASEFIAMSASVIDSAEDLMNTIAEKKVDKIITELDDQSIIILGCEKNTFLVLIIGNTSKVEEIFKNFDDYIQKIMEVY